MLWAMHKRLERKKVNCNCPSLFMQTQFLLAPSSCTLDQEFVLFGSLDVSLHQVTILTCKIIYRVVLLKNWSFTKTFFGSEQILSEKIIRSIGNKFFFGGKWTSGMGNWKISLKMSKMVDVYILFHYLRLNCYCWASYFMVQLWIKYITFSNKTK